MMFWSDHDMSGWAYAGMVIGMVLFWVLVIAGIIALIRYSSVPIRAAAAPQQYGETAEQVLATRFARGEIDETEYQQRLAVLRASR